VSPDRVGKGSVARWAVALALWVGVTSCTGPALSFDAYEGKAVSTAETATSQVETSILAAHTAAEGRLANPTVTVLLEDAESGATHARDTFASIQPPDPASDGVRSELLPILDRAVGDIGAMRIASRRGDLEAVGRLGDDLVGIGDSLDRFVSIHR
jgi:hypothetical protein